MPITSASGFCEGNATARFDCYLLTLSLEHVSHGWADWFIRAVNAAYPTTRSALSFFKMRTHSLGVFLSRFCFLDRDNPADPHCERVGSSSPMLRAPWSRQQGLLVGHLVLRAPRRRRFLFQFFSLLMDARHRKQVRRPLDLPRRYRRLITAAPLPTGRRSNGMTIVGDAFYLVTVDEEWCHGRFERLGIDDDVSSIETVCSLPFKPRS